MICKACGEPLNPGDEVCPNCKQRIAFVEGGVGFWDLLDGQQAQDQGQALTAPLAPQVTQASYSQPDNRSGSSNPAPRIEAEKKRLPLPAIVGGAAACCLMFFGLGYLTVSNMRANSQITELQKQVNELESQATQAAAEAAAQQEEQQGPAGILPVSEAPSDAQATVGQTSEGDQYLFRVVTAKSVSVDDVEWQKHDGQTWVPLQFDDTGYNEEYGLRLRIQHDKGISALLAENLTAKSEGEYRCVIADGTWNYACPVTLKVEPSPDAAASSDQQEGDANADAQDETVTPGPQRDGEAQTTQDDAATSAPQREDAAASPQGDAANDQQELSSSGNVTAPQVIG